MSVSTISAEEAPVWETVCPEAATPIEPCRIVQQLFLSQTVEGESQTVGRILQLTVLYVEDAEGNRAPYLGIQLPLGVDLRLGAVLRVDEGEEIAVPYLQCTQAGCDASIKLEAKLLWAMKRGEQFLVGFPCLGERPDHRSQRITDRFH